MEHHIATVSALIADRRREGHDVSGLRQTLAWLRHSAGKRTRDNDDVPDQAAAQRAIEAAVERKECPAYEDLMAFVSKDKIAYLWRGEGTDSTSRIFAFVNEKDYDYQWFDDIMYGMSGTWFNANVRATDNVWVFRTYKPTDAEARFITRPEADGGDEFNGDEEAYNNLVMRDEYLKHELREHGHVYAFEPLAHQGVMVFNFDSWFTIVDEEFWTAERVLARLIRTSAERLRERVDELPTWAREQIAANNLHGSVVEIITAKNGRRFILIRKHGNNDEYELKNLENDELAGTATIHVDDKDDDEKARLWLEGVSVEKPYQGIGLCTKMITAGLRDVISRLPRRPRYGVAQLYTSQPSAAATCYENAYAALGYVFRYTQETEYPSYPDDDDDSNYVIVDDMEEYETLVEEGKISEPWIQTLVFEYQNWQKLQHSTAKDDCGGEGQIISSAEITEFLQNPRHWILDGFLLTKHLDSEAEDSEEDESVAPLGKIDELLLTWSIFIKDSGKEIAFAQLAGYFDGDDVVIESFWVNPEGQGHGRSIIEWLHNLLAERSIRLSVTQDQTQEGKGFWSKMHSLGFIQ